MEQICKECNGTFKSERSLHTHLKAHKISVGEYYSKHYPRFDKEDNSPILFEDKEQYFSTDFNSKENMKVWFRKADVLIAKEYAQKLLIDRKEKKHLTYAPSQIELRSLISPTILTYNKLFKNYYNLCEKLGFKNKYSIPALNPFLNEGLTKGSKILIDTREQNPLSFSIPKQIETLKFGDYCFSDLEHTNNTYIERKSINDFISTLGFGLERFKREIERAQQSNATLIVLVEETLDRALNFTSLNVLPDKAKVTESFIFHNVRDLMQTYPNIQFLFVNGREEASKTIETLFSAGKIIQTIDLQLAKDLGKI